MSKTKDGVAGTQVATKQLSTSLAKKTSTKTDDTLKTVQGYVKSWSDYRKKLMVIWERDTKLFNNERVKPHYQGVADTFVPMTRSTIETINAALSTGDLNTEFIPQDIYQYLKDNLSAGFNPESGMSEEDFLARAIQNALQGGIIDDESLKVVNSLYDYYWDKDDWDLKLPKFIKSALKIGNGALWEVWENDRPKLINVAFPDFVFDPTCVDDDGGRFKGRRYLASLSGLKKETIIDPDTGKTKKRYNLKGVTSKKLYDKDKTDKQLKEEILLGSTVDTSGEDLDQVEVIEIRAGDRQYVLINRTVLAEDIENPIITQAKLRGIDASELILYPCITWANYEDESMYIGESETSTFWKEQERLNDTTNQKSDAVTRALLQTYRADPQLKSQKNSFSVPGATIWGSTGQFEAIPPARVPGEAFNEESSIKNNIREVTATDQIVKGVGSTSDITATEANLQVAQSGQRIEMKVASLTRGPLKRLARLTLQYIRLFKTDPFIFPQSANSGFGVMFYDPKKFNYVYEPKVTLTLTAKSQKRAEQNEASNTFKMLISDPTNNLQEVKKTMLPKIADLDSDEVKKIIENPDAAPQGQPSPEMMQSGAPA